MSAQELLLLACVTAVLTAGLVGAYLNLARRKALLAIPEARSSHTVPTPVGGGLGIIVAVLVALAASRVGDRGDLWVAAALLVATLTGFADDRRALRATPKMLLVLFAGVLALPGATISEVTLPYVGQVPFGVLALPLSLFWLVGFAHAFNFMDGINGLAGITLVVTGGAFSVGGWLRGDGETAVLGATLVGGGLGFLPWNFPKARIFMGDAGALPLGLLLAVTAIRASRPVGAGGVGASGGASVAVLAFPACVLLVGPYVFDVTFTLWRRWREGKPLGQAHKEHLYQRLARGLGSHARSTWLYGLVEVATAFLALTYDGRGDLGRILSLLCPPFALLAFVPLVFRLEARRSRIDETKAPKP